MNYRLHYAELKANGDIPVYEFETMKKLIDFVDQKYFEKSPKERNKIFYLFSKGNYVFVTEHYTFLQISILEIPIIETTGDFFIKEYESFEKAYEVALLMKELNLLCYSKK